jgi:hypothetical protein
MRRICWLADGLLVHIKNSSIWIKLCVTEYMNMEEWMIELMDQWINEWEHWWMNEWLRPLCSLVLLIRSVFWMCAASSGDDGWHWSVRISLYRKFLCKRALRQKKRTRIKPARVITRKCTRLLGYPQNSLYIVMLTPDCQSFCDVMAVSNNITCCYCVIWYLFIQSVSCSKKLLFCGLREILLYISAFYSTTDISFYVKFRSLTCRKLTFYHSR